MAAKTITRQGVVTTTGVTPAAVLSVAIPDQVRFQARVRVSGGTANGSKYHSWEDLFSGYRNAGGNITFDAVATTIRNVNNDAGLVVGYSGTTTFQVDVTGLASTTIYWGGLIELTYWPTA